MVEQLELCFRNLSVTSLSGRDAQLEAQASELLRLSGAGAIAGRVQVEWSPRLRSAAGRAQFHNFLITLNPRLHEHGLGEVDRTFRHELAHLLAYFRAGRRRISPHGSEWRAACRDLAIPGESRCHALPLPTVRRRPRYLYRCPECRRDFPRVRRIQRAVACLACCRKFTRGRFDRRFGLRLVAGESRA
ncbi:MAG: SprT-like domain-containing protein [Chthoniobacterales bacterium]